MEEYTCVPVDITRATAQELDFWMSRFIMECRRDNGTPYPPNTLVEKLIEYIDISPDFTI
jgi:hypothetical protein